MKIKINKLRGRGALALLVPVLLACGLVLGGCESDTLAPQDQTPPLSEQEAAGQAGLVAMAVAKVAPEVVKFSEAGKTVYSRTFVGLVSGTVSLDYRLGGAGGVSANWSTGDWARLYTAIDDPLNLAVGSGSVQLTLDVTADINQGQDTAVIGGGGTFTSGVHHATFAFADLAVTAAGSYPAGGTMTFSGAGFVMAVDFDGTNLATIAVMGHGTWSLNLDTGAVSTAG